jgi:hypothetical protein
MEPWKLSAPARHLPRTRLLRDRLHLNMMLFIWPMPTIAPCRVVRDVDDRALMLYLSSILILPRIVLDHIDQVDARKLRRVSVDRSHKRFMHLIPPIHEQDHTTDLKLSLFHVTLPFCDSIAAQKEVNPLS